MVTSPSSKDSIESDDDLHSTNENAPGENRQGMSALQLLNSSYKDLGTPPEVGERFLQFLLHNENYNDSGLLRIIQLDHERITKSYQRNNATKTGSKDGNDANFSDSKQQMKMREDVSLQINAWELIQYDYELGDMLLRFPSTLLPLLEEAAIEALKIILRKTLGFIYNASQNYYAQHSCYPPVMKRVDTLLKNMHHQPNRRGDQSENEVQQQRQWKIHARIMNLPPTHTCCKPSISSIQAHDIGKIVQLSGTVVRISPIQMLEVSRAYQCTKCKHTFCIYADFQQCNNALPHPTNCPGSPTCTSTSFDSLPHRAIHTDYQEIKLQESRNALASIPRSILCKLQHDLVDSCQPGDDVFVVGNLMAQWQPVVPNIDCTITMALHVHSIKVVNKDSDSNSSTWGNSENISGSGKMRDKFRREFEEFWNDPMNRIWKPIAARNFICRAICPKLYGMMTIKIALLLTLIGGSSSMIDSSLNGVDSGTQTQCERRAIFGNNSSDSQQNRQNLSDNEENAITINDNDDGTDGGEDSEPEAFFIDPPLEEDKKKSTSSKHVATSERKMDRELPLKSSINAAKHDFTTSTSQKHGGSIQTKRRAESHILLVGDPGTGKSQFLRFAAALSPRSVMTTGIGTTNAGLTCAAVRVGNNGSKQYTLEAGALVLADRGVCCIDEFGCIREEDRAAIHEAMEQQTISVAKAGIVCKLNSRATVVAVMNPKGAIYATNESLSKNTNISTPLLSRFDLIFVLLDGAGVDEITQDKNISTFLLNDAIHGCEKLDVEDLDNPEMPGALHCTITSSHSKHPDASTGKSSHWNIDKLRAYIATVKEKFHPKLSIEAAHLLQAHYERCRASHSTSVQITVRFLESLIRLSQAHARLMYRNVVERDDAVAVILIVECSAATSAGLSCNLVDEHDNLFEPPMSCEFDSTENADGVFQAKLKKVLLRYCGQEEVQRKNDGNNKQSTNWNDGHIHHGVFVHGQNSMYEQGSQRVDTYGRSHFFSPSKHNNNPQDKEKFYNFRDDSEISRMKKRQKSDKIP